MTTRVLPPARRPSIPAVRRVEPGPGQESVWDYPRPPRVEPSPRLVRIVWAGVEVVSSRRSLRVLETSHPPVHYVPLEDIVPGLLEPSRTTSFCEYKGRASYFDLARNDQRSVDAAWTYEHPAPGYESLARAVAFYPDRVDACFLDGERVVAQPGGFYGGWITSDVVGPFKGPPGTRGW